MPESRQYERGLAPEAESRPVAVVSPLERGLLAAKVLAPRRPAGAAGAWSQAGPTASLGLAPAPAETTVEAPAPVTVVLASRGPRPLEQATQGTPVPG